MASIKNICPLCQSEKIKLLNISLPRVGIEVKTKNMSLNMHVSKIKPEVLKAKK